jgi:hypothetical protein
MTPSDEAKRLSILFEYGVRVSREAIAWADSQIAATDSPSETLLQLSTTSPARTAEMLSHLHVLATGADFWCALRAAMPRLREHLVTHPSDAERVARELFQVVVSADSVPEEFDFAYRFDDAFGLAHNQIFGDLEAVRREFIDELARFTTTV